MVTCDALLCVARAGISVGLGGPATHYLEEKSQGLQQASAAGHPEDSLRELRGPGALRQSVCAHTGTDPRAHACEAHVAPCVYVAHVQHKGPSMHECTHVTCAPRYVWPTHTQMHLHTSRNTVHTRSTCTHTHTSTDSSEPEGTSAGTDSAFSLR